MSTFNDEAARRAYWADQMEQGYAIVQKLIEFPVNECGERFASLPEAAAAANVEMLFSSSKIAGELERVYFMRESLVQDVVTIGREMNERSWVLKIEDCFRSLDMQRQLVRKPSVFDNVLKKCIWELGGAIPTTEMMFRRAIVLTANMPKIGAHMSGSAIDISVFHRDDGTEVWRGYPYLEMSECTPMRSPFVAPEHVATRLEIASMMEKHGFIHFPFELHILTGNPAPCRFGPVNWNPQTNEVTPVENPLELLNPLSVIEKEIAAALERMQAA
jgi:D-alanyl-D-alanine dipeptidase